jgi:hypothetical protein
MSSELPLITDIPLHKYPTALAKPDINLTATTTADAILRNERLSVSNGK